VIVFRIPKSFTSPQFLRISFFFFSCFLLIFPKGGVKLGSIPITWGYLFLGLTSLTLISRDLFKISKMHFYAFILLLPFQMVSLMNFALNGIKSYGFAISFFISFFILPVIFFLILSEYLSKLDLQFFGKILKKGIFFLSVYGIFLFFYKIVTGKFFAIPLLTMNLGDSMGFEDKCISRGSISKLISTYNNGNIFGICILMLLPLYQYFEKNFFKRNITKLALVLTISRTVWIGLIIHEFIDLFFLQRKKISNYFKITIILFSIVFLIVFLLKSINVSLLFLFDLTLGSRINQFEAIVTSGLFAASPFYAITEIVYLGILNSFGYFGLLTFLIAITGPILLYKMQRKKDLFSKSVALGLGIYLIISLSDGAMQFIPVMAFYWFLASLLLGRQTAPAFCSDHAQNKKFYN